MTATENYVQRLAATAERMSDTSLMKGLFHQHRHGDPLPSAPALQEIVALCRAVLFPGYYGRSALHNVTIRYHIGTALEQLFALLTSQVEAGLCFDATSSAGSRHDEAAEIAAAVIDRLPQVRRTLATDVEAAYLGDPAAQNYGEVISCYPVIKALTCYRVAHELYQHHVPLIPRILTEMAHSETGIDIHPGAQIGEQFTIDHGTGVVIGETCIIGNSCRLYQGVTLGALSFPKNADGTLTKGIPRHPILEDKVTVYAGATILGRVTVGRGAVIGGNVWITDDVPAGAKVTQERPS